MGDILRRPFRFRYPRPWGCRRTRSLWMFVSNDKLEPDLEWESADLDEMYG